ncbi:MAG: hypothetical protein HZA46_22165 [Planctomycetales bacterium]|nr:hypothetical protein [Planctomycetales bacterium]
MKRIPRHSRIPATRWTTLRHGIGIAPAPVGATLAEALVAMLVMSIGVVSLASLFPLAIVRSIHATQLTNATNLRYNAESIIDMNRVMLITNLPPVAPITPPPATEPQAPQVYAVDPLGWSIAAESGVATYYRIGGATGLVRWNGGFNTEAAAAGFVTLPDSWIIQTKSLPDLAAAIPINITSVTFPATVDLTSVAFAPPAESRVVVFNPASKLSEVRRITGIVGQTVTWAATQPLPMSVLEDQNGNSALDAGEDYNGNTILDPVGDVWIETRDRRYTWLLNVRRYGNRANVEVVSFMGREFTSDDEQAYAANFYTLAGRNGTAADADDYLGADNQPGIAGFDDDGDGTVDNNTGGPNNTGELGWPGTDDSRTIYNVTWVAGTTPPTIRKGGWVLDPLHARWYRISGIFDPVSHQPVQSLSTFSGNSVDLTVDRDLIEVSTPANPGTAIFMRGVIEVYPIGIKEF